MALATQPDVETILGRSLTVDEASRVVGLLDEASDLVAGYLVCPVADPTPGAVVRVVAAMVAAVLNRPSSIPENADSLAAGPFNVHFSQGTTSAGPWLTQALKLRLRPYRCAVVSVPVVSERS